MRKILTEEQEAFFISHQQGLLLQEAADLMNETFGLQLTAAQVRDQRSRLKVGGGKFFIPHPSRRLFTEEQQEFFVRNQYGLTRAEAAELMNKTFGLNITPLQVKGQRTRLGVKGGPKELYCSRFGPNSGHFSKGRKPFNNLPVGTELVKTDGYLWRKIAEPNKWKQVHILVWEEAHGPREKGHKIIFLNGNRMDVRPENLTAVTDSVNSYLNTRHLRYDRAELTQAGINVAELLSACHQKKKGAKK